MGLPSECKQCREEEEEEERNLKFTLCNNYYNE